ncbi:hypothetical protein E1B28_006969 [Marasmius oreades]|uniref:F-box domain-containing protein n=1 Tax=Marasmius oreades TaxID=181124 RepID=A0A9P7USY8_9AGAR|nr:uncharacterized protein E1B28_006969 [Marasmius oreades]KAG7093287.1 hypothetical protein E1B28_006969 [Marasmius oreades]
MSRYQSNDTPVQSHQPALCERCHRMVNIPLIRPFHMIEPRFLYSEYIPSETETSRLREVVTDGEEEIKRYEEDMAVLQQTLDQLTRAKSAVEITTRKCRAALSVHRRVPQEVWEIVFSTLCLSLHDYSFNIDYNSPSPLLGLPATILSQVCSRWKAIVKGSPSLWSSLNVNIREISYNILRPLTACLENSRGIPLKLRIESALKCVQRQLWNYEVWRTLSEHIYRSRELVLAIRYDDCADALSPIQHLTFPTLESFCEEIASPAVRLWPWFWQPLRNATKLVTVSGGRFLESNMPWSQLTTLNVSLANGVRMFIREVNLPSLQRLSVCVRYHSWLSAILESFIMPSLETCDIQHGKWPLPSSFLTLVIRSSSSLKQITITVRLKRSGSNLSQDPLVFNVLQAAPQLTYFKLSVERAKGANIQPYHSLSDDLISTLLSELKDNLAFLPKLGFLSLEFSDITLNAQVVVGVLEAVSARQLTPHPLTELRIVRLSGTQVNEVFTIEPELLDRIKMLEQNRIKVVIEDR